MSKQDEENVYKTRDYDVHAVYKHMELPAITLWETDEVLPLQEDEIHVSRQLTAYEIIHEQMSIHWKYVVGLLVALFGMQRWASAFYVMHRKRRMEADLLKESDRQAESKKGKAAKVRKGDVKRQAASDAAQDTDAPQEASTLWKPFFSPKPPRPSPKASPAASPKVPQKASPKPLKAVPLLQSTPQPLNKLPTLAECDADADATDTLQEPFSATLGVDDGQSTLSAADLEETNRANEAEKQRQEIQVAEKAVVKPSSSLQPPKPSSKTSPAASLKLPHKASPKPPKAAPSLQSTPQPIEKLPNLADGDAHATDTAQDPFSAMFGTPTVSAKSMLADANLEEVKRTHEAEQPRQETQATEKGALKPSSPLQPPRQFSKASPAASLKVLHKASPKAPKAAPSLQSTPQPLNKLPTLAESDANATDILQKPISSSGTVRVSPDKVDDGQNLLADANIEEGTRKHEAGQEKQESKGAENIAVKPASSRKPPQPSHKASPASSPKISHKASPKPSKAAPSLQSTPQPIAKLSTLAACDEDGTATVQEPALATLGTSVESRKKEYHVMHILNAEDTNHGAKGKKVTEAKKAEETTNKVEETSKVHETVNAKGATMVEEVSKVTECAAHTEEAHRTRPHAEDAKKDFGTKTLTDAKKKAKPTKVAKEAFKIEASSPKIVEGLQRADEVRGKTEGEEEELQKAAEARKQSDEKSREVAAARKSTEKAVKAGQTRNVEESGKQTEKQKSDEAKGVQESSEEAEGIEADRKQAAEALRKAEEARELAEAELRKAADIRKLVEEELRKAEEARKLGQAISSDTRRKSKEASEAIELGQTAEYEFVQKHETCPRNVQPEESSALQWLNQDLQESSTEWLEVCPETTAEPLLDHAKQVHGSPAPPAPSSPLLQAWAGLPPGFADIPLGPPPGLAPPPGLEMFGPGSKFH